MDAPKRRRGRRDLELRFLDRMRYCESLMLPPGFDTSRRPHKHPHNFCRNMPNPDVSVRIQSWSPLAMKQSNRSDRNKLNDTHERRGSPLTGQKGLLITQRSQVQILPPQPKLCPVAPTKPKTLRSAFVSRRLCLSPAFFRFCYQTAAKSGFPSCKHRLLQLLCRCFA